MMYTYARTMTSERQEVERPADTLFRLLSVHRKYTASRSSRIRCLFQVSRGTHRDKKANGFCLHAPYESRGFRNEVLIYSKYTTNC
jgi:hypothetical protein